MARKENKDLEQQNPNQEDKDLEQQNQGEEDMAKEEVKVKLKSNYPKFDKDGKKIGKYKPDEVITLPIAEAEKLIKSAMAIEVYYDNSSIFFISFYAKFYRQ